MPPAGVPSSAEAAGDEGGGLTRVDDNGAVDLSVLGTLVLGLTDNAGPYALMIGGGFLVGVYAHAAKMPRLLAVAILFVLLSSLLAIAVSFSYEGSAPQVKP
jgi:hypothetical protein